MMLGGLWAGGRAAAAALAYHAVPGSVQLSSVSGLSWQQRAQVMEHERLDFGLPAVSKARHPGVVGAKHCRPHETSVVRIVLTGGPCAGKSSALRKLTAAANSNGFDVYLAPECATILFSNGCSAADFGVPGYSEAYNKSITQLQLQMERSFTRIAASTGRPSILVCDRGIMDNKGYIAADGWDQTLQFVDGEDAKASVTEDYVLARYDLVIHMDTAAKGAEKYYKWGETTDDNGHTVIRSESPEVARQLDDKMLACWEHHPNHVRVRNSEAGFHVRAPGIRLTMSLGCRSSWSK